MVKWLEAHPEAAALLASTGKVISGVIWLKNLTPVGFLSALIIDYGYDKLMELADLKAAKVKLSAYLQSKDGDLNKDQADILAGAAIKFAKEAGRVLTHKFSKKGFDWAKKELTASKTKVAKELKGSKGDRKKVGKERSNIKIDERNIKHIFREKKGHIVDTPSNRKLLEEVANDNFNKLGTDKYGNVWHGKILEDGTQVWTRSQAGKITNGGINQIPKSFHPETGLAAPTKFK